MPSSSQRSAASCEHRLQAAAVGRLAARRQCARMLEEHASADRPSAEELAAGERGREVAIGLLPASEQRRELAEPQRDRAERLLRVRDGVVVVVREQKLVELEPALRVADENGRLGQRAQVEDPETVAREICEAPRRRGARARDVPSARRRAPRPPAARASAGSTGTAPRDPRSRASARAGDPAPNGSRASARSGRRTSRTRSGAAGRARAPPRQGARRRRKRPSSVARSVRRQTVCQR